MTELTIAQQVQNLVDAAIAAGKEHDAIQLEILQTLGLSFKETANRFNAAMIAGGHMKTAKARKEEISAILEENNFAPVEWPEVVEAAAKISAAVADTTEKQAISVIKSWAKANEVALPAKPKGARGPRESIFASLLNHIVTVGPMTDEQVDAKIVEMKPQMKEAQRGKYVLQVRQAVEFAAKLNA